MQPLRGVMLGSVAFDGSAGAPAAVPEGPGWRPHVGRAFAWVLIAAAVVVTVMTFEFVVYMAALILFSHMDTPDCAAVDTFCSPDGRSGLTGGAIVVFAGNLVAVVGAAAALFARQKSRNARM